MSRKKKIIMIVLIIIVVALVMIRLANFIQNLAAQDEAEQGYIPVNAQTVQKGVISNTVALTGKIEPVEEVYVIPLTPGTVESVTVKVGDTVTKDQILFTIDKEDIQNSYNQAAAALKAAQANYQATKEQHDQAVSDLAKYRELYEAGGISQAELEQAELMASGASLSAAQAQVEQAQAALESVNDALQDTGIKAPISGIVTALTVGVGDMASSASPAATIVNMDQVYVNIGVSENIINSISIGQEVSVEIPAAQDKKLTGKIDDLSLAADAVTGKYNMKVYIDNADHLFKSGMFAQVELATETISDVVVVPTDAIVYHNGEYVAYIVSDQIAMEKPVTTGLDNGEEIEVISGLEPGELLIVTGQRYVLDGSIVKIITLDGVPTEAETGNADETGGQNK